MLYVPYAWHPNAPLVSHCNCCHRPKLITSSLTTSSKVLITGSERCVTYLKILSQCSAFYSLFCTNSLSSGSLQKRNLWHGTWSCGQIVYFWKWSRRSGMGALEKRNREGGTLCQVHCWVITAVGILEEQYRTNVRIVCWCTEARGACVHWHPFLIAPGLPCKLPLPCVHMCQEGWVSSRSIPSSSSREQGLSSAVEASSSQALSAQLAGCCSHD